MNRSLVIGIMLLLVLGSSASQEKKITPKPTSYVGILVDAMCAKSMVKQGPEKAMEKAKRHTRECNFHDECAASGLGLMFDGTFHPFDSAGSAVAMSYLKSISQKNNIEVKVTGTMTGNVLSVKKLQAK